MWITSFLGHMVEGNRNKARLHVTSLTKSDYSSDSPLYPSRLFLTFSTVGNTWKNQEVLQVTACDLFRNWRYMIAFSCWYPTSCKFGYLCGVKSLLLFLAVDRLSSHSEQSHWWLEGPRDPTLENWPTTGQLSSTSTCKGPHSERTWQEEECTSMIDK